MVTSDAIVVRLQESPEPEDVQRQRRRRRSLSAGRYRSWTVVVFWIPSLAVATIPNRMSDRHDEKRGPRRVPLLPLRDIVVFPHMVVPLFVGREKSISALDEAMGKGGDKEIFLAAQRKAKTNEPMPEDIFTIGTIGTIIQLLRLPDGTVKVLVEGKRRATVRRFTQTDGFFMVEIEELPDVQERSVEVDALVR